MKLHKCWAAMAVMLSLGAEAGTVTVTSLYAFETDVHDARSWQRFDIYFDATGWIIDSARLWYKASNPKWTSKCDPGEPCNPIPWPSPAGTGQVSADHPDPDQDDLHGPWDTIEAAEPRWYGGLDVMRLIGSTNNRLRSYVDFRNSVWDNAASVFHNGRLDITYHRAGDAPDSSVPVPGTLPLALCTLAALGLASRRRMRG